MTAIGERIARSASELVGTSFRLHGRSRESGLDCVGLVTECLALAGMKPVAPTGYAMRNSNIDGLLMCAKASGLGIASGRIRPGDILLVRPGPAQHHLVVAEDTRTFVHAHASLRRVVRSRSPLPWKISRHWRAYEPEES